MRVAKPQIPDFQPSFLKREEWEAILVALRLCRRECQIVSGVIAGESEAKLAETLGISAHTVHTYTDRLYRRLGVRSRCELVVRVFEAYARHVKRSVTDPLKDAHQ